MKNLREHLIAARKLIEDPAKWSQGGSGAKLGTLCLIEAFIHAEVKFGNCGSPKENREALGFPPDGLGSVTSFNDTHTHAEVLAHLDAQIAKHQ